MGEYLLWPCQLEEEFNTMSNDVPSEGIPMYHAVVVRPDPPGQYTAQVVAFPQIRATASTEQGALEEVQGRLAEWLATARWVQVKVPTPPTANPALEFAGHMKDDPLFDEFLEEIERYRREVDERECPNSSSIPNT
jgi:hypothetical protein